MRDYEIGQGRGQLIDDYLQLIKSRLTVAELIQRQGGDLTPARVHKRTHDLKKRLIEYLRLEIAATLGTPTPDSIDEEARYILNLLAENPESN